MKLNGLSELTPTEARVESWMASLPVQYRTLTEESAETVTFDYPNYNLDPRPTVLVLGQWDKEDGKTLIGGLNVNYMTSAELERVSDVLPDILKAGNLKARYWAGRKLLPDIFGQFYRTYNKEYVNGAAAGEIKQAPEKKQKDAEKTVTGIDASQIRKAITALKKREKGQAPPEKKAVEKPQAAPVEPVAPWVSSRPKKPVAPVGPTAPIAPAAPTATKGPTAQKKVPTPEPIVPEPKKASDNRPTKPVSDKAGLDKGQEPNKAQQAFAKLAREKGPEKAVEIAKQALAKDKLDKPAKKRAWDEPLPEPVKEKPKPTPVAPATPPAPVKVAKKGAAPKPDQATVPDKPDKPKITKKKAADELSTPPGNAPQESFVPKRGFLGFVWPSRYTYREYHRPAAFLTTPALSEGTEKPLLAVYDVLTGETLIDRVDDHATIIDEAGWDYSHVIRLLPINRSGNREIATLHDGLPGDVVRHALRRIPPIVIEQLMRDQFRD